MKKTNLIVISSAFATLIGCNLGGTGSPTISNVRVTQGNCGALQNGQNCQVTLTYNTGGVESATFGVTYTPEQPTNQFTAAFGSCSTKATGEQTCQVPVTYTRPSTGRSISQTLVFTLGTAKSSNGIQFVGL